jgi:hypothetical protein
MTNLDDLCDRLHRTVKLALDSGEADSVDDAVLIFSGYRLQIVLGLDVAEDASLQTAALTPSIARHARSSAAWWSWVPLGHFGFA